MKNRHCLSILSAALWVALPTLAWGQMAPPIPGAGVPLYPAAPNTAAATPTELPGEDVERDALNRAVSRLFVEVDRGAVPADGQTLGHVTVRLFGADDKPITSTAFVTIDASSIRVLPQGAPPGPQSTNELDAGKGMPGVQLRVENGVARFALVAPTTPQEVRVRVTAGRHQAQASVSFVPAMREMLATGLLDGVVNLRGRGGDVIQASRHGDAFEQDLRRWTREFNEGQANVGARAEFFVRGVIRGDVLLTAAYDSDTASRSRLLRDVRPDEFYPVYANTSVRAFETRSAEHLYVRLDKNKSYLLYGVFPTGGSFDQGGGAAAAISQRSLGNYNRSLTGIRAHHEQANLVGNVFTTRDTLRQVVEEFASQGSGPYGLANSRAIEGTEKVEVVVRDRNQPSRIVSTRVLVPLVDYSIEPFSGRVLVNTFLPAFDGQLNPISLRVSVEVDQGGTPFWVVGADLQFKPTENTEVGGAFVNEDNPLARYRLASANAGLRLGEKTRIVVEVAQSRAEVNTNPINQNTQGGLIGQVGEVDGRAWRVEAAHEDGPFEARAFVGRSSTTFVNPASPLAGGRGEVQASLGYRLTETVKVYGEGSRGEDRNVRGGERNAGQVGANVKLSETVTLDIGVRTIREKSGTLGPLAFGAFGATSGLSGSEATGSGGGAVGFGNQLIDPGSGLPIINPGAFLPNTGAASSVDRNSDTVRVGLGWRATDKLTLGGELEQEFSGDERRRAALGGDYRFAERTKLYGRYERQTGVAGPYSITSPERHGDALVFGIDSTYLRDTQVFSEYRMRDVFVGRELQLASGVRNVWDVSEGWRVSSALEHTRVLAGTQAETSAATLGLDYSAHPLWRASTRFELRRSGDLPASVEDDTFTTALWQFTLARKLASDWTLVTRNDLLNTRYAARGDVVQNRFQVGVAYRDTDSRRISALAKVEFKRERDASSLTEGELGSKATVLSTHADFHRSAPWWLTGRAAVKWQIDQRQGAAPDSLRAQFVAGRIVHELTGNWDLGALVAAQRGLGERQSALGVEVGYLVRQNLWLAVGWNFTGFRGDADLIGSEYTQRGAYLRLRIKFDEDLFGARRADLSRSLDR